MRKDLGGVEFLENDEEFYLCILEDMRFVGDPKLELTEKSAEEQALVKVDRHDLIAYFEETYVSTVQDTVAWAPEFAVVVRMILDGKRPVKLRWLVDFKGEEK